MNTFPNQEIADSWDQFAKDTVDMLPKQASPAILSAYFLWLMKSYRPDAESMAIAMVTALGVYADWSEVPEGVTIN